MQDDSPRNNPVVARGPTKANGSPAGFNKRRPSPRILGSHIRESNLPRAQAWSIWHDTSGATSEDVFDDKLTVVAECSSSAQFHERWSKLKRSSHEYPNQMFRIFRAGILPFRTLSKNRDGGEFRCALHTGLSFGEAASCFAAIVALMIDEDLRWAEGINGVCLVISPSGHSVKLWTGSANNHGLAPISSVIEQLNVTLVENLRDPVTFHMPTKRSKSPTERSPNVVPRETRPAKLDEARTVPSSQSPKDPPPVIDTPAGPKKQYSMVHGKKVVVEAQAPAKAEERSSTATLAASPEEPSIVFNPEEPSIPVKTKKEKKKKKAAVDEAAAVVEKPEKVELTPEQRRSQALEAAERAFLKNEGNNASEWSRERSIAWLWLLAFPLVYIVIGWLFCLVMNKTNPGAYPQRFLF